MSRLLFSEFRSPLVDPKTGILTKEGQRKLAGAIVLDAFGNVVWTEQQIVAGGSASPANSGAEPFTAQGSGAGYSMDDRAGSAHPRWVIYATGGKLFIYNQTNTNVLSIDVNGNVRALGTITPSVTP